MAAVFAAAGRRGRRTSTPTNRASTAADLGDGGDHPRSRRGPLRGRHRPARPRRQGARASRSTSSAACPPTSRRPTSRSASTSPRSWPQSAARAADFPALKIKCGGPRISRRSKRSAAVFSGPDPGRRQHGLDPGRGRRAAARARAPRRRAHRAAVPGRAARPAALAPGTLVAADRRRRELRPAGGPRPPRRGRRRGQRQARQMRRDRSGQADARACPRPRLQDVPRLHGGDARSRSPGPRSSPRWPTGSISTAACSSPTTRSTGSSSTPTTAGSCRTARVSA